MNPFHFAILRRLNDAPAAESFVLRGSFVLAALIGPERRQAQDLDFLALYPYNPQRIAADFEEILEWPCDDGFQFPVEAIELELTWQESVSPGVRLIVTGHRKTSHSANSSDSSEPAAIQQEKLQIDIGFGDPLGLPLERLSYNEQRGQSLTAAISSPGNSRGAGSLHDFSGFTEVRIPALANQFAWKLHGLVERADNAWRPKDLNDLWLMTRAFDLQPEALKIAIKLAFESRDAPYWRLDRFMSGEFGESPRSQKQWKRFLRDLNFGETAASLAEARDAVIAHLTGFWDKLRVSGPPPWPVDLNAEQVSTALEGFYHFRQFPWELSKDVEDNNDNEQALEGTQCANGVVFSYLQQNSETFPEPLWAETGTEFVRRQIFREARGLTFDAQGRVIARPIPKFFNLPARHSLSPEAYCLEKLDGSLVFPTYTEVRGQKVADEQGKLAWVMRTRRGRSSISEQAQRFVEQARETASRNDHSSVFELIETLLAAGLTPCFEWCSRQHIIVLDHPEDRLVLTQVRDNKTGMLWSPKAVAELAQRYHTESVQILGRFADFEDFVAEVKNWRGREGCIIQDGQQLYKLKSLHYKELHQAIEGPSKDIARWRLILNADTSDLLHSSQLRGIELSAYVADVLQTIEQLKSDIQDVQQAAVQNNEVQRSVVAKLTKSWFAPVRKAAFCVLDGQDPHTALIRELLVNCQSRGALKKMAEALSAPFLGD